ncbi:MAG: iron-containing alcohol dehydrogenase [Spirochaetales bacterium]
MKKLELYERYRRLTRREARGPRLVVGSPESLARGLRALLRDADNRILLLADRNTAAAAPELVNALAGCTAETILPGTPPVVPEILISEEIARKATESRARGIVVLGGGALTDLAKYAARVAGIDLISVPTAASVDAYTSEKSALRVDGYHSTPEAKVPSAILASPQIIEAAPTALTLSGLGDLVAKLIASLDWEVSSLITGESFTRREAQWSERAARQALARLRHAGLREAAFAGLDSLLVTGRAMRLEGSSRPAASAEHTFAHLWEVALEGEPTGDAPDAGAVGGTDTTTEPTDERIHYHGLLVTVAARYVTVAYRWIAEQIAAGAKPHEPWPRREEAGRQSRVPADMAAFLEKMREESAGRVVNDRVVAERRALVERHRGTIVEIAHRTLSDAERALESLAQAGIGAYLPLIPTHWVRRALEWVKYLRNRYSMFDLAFEMGWEQELLQFMDERLESIGRS